MRTRWPPCGGLLPRSVCGRPPCSPTRALTSTLPIDSPELFSHSDTFGTLLDTLSAAVNGDPAICEAHERPTCKNTREYGPDIYPPTYA